jgi:hypothetical protein
LVLGLVSGMAEHIVVHVSLQAKGRGSALAASEDAL